MAHANEGDVFVMRSIVSTFAFALCLAPCIAGGDETRNDVGGSKWSATIILQTENGLGGVAIGDLSPAHPGNEVFAVSSTGEVWMAYRDDDAWRSEQIHRGGGELIMCAVGDVDPRYEGNELVAVGMVSGPESREGPGHVVMVRRDGDGWKSEEIFRDDRMIHGVAVGDVSARHEGDEVLIAGFNHRVRMLSMKDDHWHEETIYVANDRLKIVQVADLCGGNAVSEAVCCGSDGQVVLLWEGELGWHHEVVYADRFGQSRIAPAPVEILIGGDGGKITLAVREGDAWKTECIGRDTAKMRGVAIADVLPSRKGPEYFACGYSTSVLHFTRQGKNYWRSEVIYRDERPLHHLAAGDVDLTRPGMELVTCGHGGRLILLTPAK